MAGYFITLRVNIAMVVLAACRVALADPAFVHPGLLQSRSDLARIKAAVTTKQEPVYSGYKVFSTNAESELSYKIRGPLSAVGRNPTVGRSAYDSDANAAYQCAIMWCITGNRAYAEKSIGIIDAWSSTLKSITGRDAVLMAGLGPFKMVNAAEILRYTDAGWSPAEIQQTEKDFREVVYPVIQNFAPFANGNWDTAAIKTMMAIGVFCNDRPMFERALRYYLDGTGDGCLTHYIINDAGQCQESGRDQQHTQLGLAHMGDCCEIAWHQGLNLYGYKNNLLLKAFEYTAKYNLGEEVPFQETTDRTGKYHHTIISSNGRGHFRSVYEEIYNAYANRLGVAAPFVGQVVDKIRPEGPGVPTARSSADHVGFGTLLFAQPVAGSAQVPAMPAAPAGLIAESSAKAIKLSWVGSLGAMSYTLKRAMKDNGYKVIAQNVTSTTYTDNLVEQGEVYQYVVCALNPKGESPDSFPVSVCAGLPKPWIVHSLGSTAETGTADFDGAIFRLEGAGAPAVGTHDECQFVCAPIDGDCTMVARFVPQTSSQFCKFGLMMRGSMDPGAANASLLISSQPRRDIEEPGWCAELSARKLAGANTSLCATSEELSGSAVNYGRLTGFIWLKLRRSSNDFTGSISSDGKNWTQVGSTTVQLKQTSLAGMAVSSQLQKITTAVNFDNVSLTADGNTSPKSKVMVPGENVSVNVANNLALP